jgi:hypothetical protein
MSSFVQKATPFFEHILVGLAFAWMGYVFFWTFNNSFYGILGMAAVCFGGLKILIGVIIYSVTVLAMIFPKYFPRKKEQATVGEPAPPVSFIMKYRGVILELTILLIGVLVIVITKSGI